VNWWRSGVLYQLYHLTRSAGRLRVELGLPDDALLLGMVANFYPDRRKDQLLQENGYLVLRFLAEDVGKELNLVLDAILRALSHRRASALPPSTH